jgi:hypothetical protein
MLSRARNLIILAGLLTMMSAMFFLVGGGQPRIALNFLRYENDRCAAVLQITNLSRCTVAYTCWLGHSLKRGYSPCRNEFGYIGLGSARIIEAKSAREFTVQIKASGEPDTGVSSVRIHYWRHSSLWNRIRSFFKMLDVPRKETAFEVIIDLPAAEDLQSDLYDLPFAKSADSMLFPQRAASGQVMSGGGSR